MILSNSLVMSRVKQFEIQHGDDAVFIGGWFVFSDGAMRERNPEGALMDPPSNPRECCKIKLDYQTKRLEQAISAFEELQAALRVKTDEAVKWANAKAPPAPPTDQDIQELKRLQGVVKQRRKIWEQARADYDASVPKQIQERGNRAVGHQERATSVRAQIDRIKI
ncbi:MAG: hypothetical protein K8T89_07655 [Planctomycetes bacterium]|nr:hypothetical protein [Planctomycetota bacterium]